MKFKHELRRCLFVLEQSDIQWSNLSPAYPPMALLTSSVLTLHNNMHYWCVNTGRVAVACRSHMDTLYHCFGPVNQERWETTVWTCHCRAHCQALWRFVVKSCGLSRPAVQQWLWKSPFKLDKQLLQPGWLLFCWSKVAKGTGCSDNRTVSLRFQVKCTEAVVLGSGRISVCSAGEEKEVNGRVIRRKRRWNCCPLLLLTPQSHISTAWGDSLHLLSQVDLITVNHRLRSVKNKTRI